MKHESWCSFQSSVSPTCGRVVGFNSSNYHGVKAVQKGQRCAIAMWYTLDPYYKEAAHDIAKHILRTAIKKPKPQGPDGTKKHEHSELWGVEEGIISVIPLIQIISRSST